MVHLTQIEGDYPCDTFFPPLDGAQYRLWSASAPQRHKDDRYSFLCYTRAGSDGGGAPRLLPGVASRHEEHQVNLRVLPASFALRMAAECCAVADAHVISN